MKFIFKYFSQLLSSIVGNYYGHVTFRGVIIISLRSKVSQNRPNVKM